MGCLPHVRPVLHHWRVVFGFGIISMLMRFPRRELRGLCAGRSSPISLPPSARRVMWSPSPLGLVLLVSSRAGGTPNGRHRVMPPVEVVHGSAGAGTSRPARDAACHFLSRKRPISDGRRWSVVAVGEPLAPLTRPRVRPSPLGNGPRR